MAYLIAPIALIGVPVFGLILKSWRIGIYATFSWLLFGDTLRKLVPGQPASFILVGDAILLITYVSFIFSRVVRGKNIWNPPFLISLIIFAGFVVINVLNQGVPSFFTGLIGLRSYLWFLPLLFLGYEFFSDKEQFKKIIEKFVYFSIPFFILAAIQFFIPSDLPIFKNFETGWQGHSFGIAGFGDLEKIPSFFGSDQRYGMISMLWFFLGLGIYSKGNTLLKLSIVSSLLGVIISGSRSAFVLTFLGVILFFLFIRREAISRGEKNVLISVSWQKLLMTTGGILLFLFLLYVMGVAAGLSNLIAVLNVFNSRAPHFFSRDLPAVLEYITPFGHGTGTLSQGLEEIGQFGGTIKEAAYYGGETGVKRIFFELGIVGFLVFYIFWAKILFFMRKAWQKIKDFEVKRLMIPIIIFLILILMRFTFVHHQVLGDSVILASLWFFIGVFFRMTSQSIKYEPTNSQI